MEHIDNVKIRISAPGTIKFLIFLFERLLDAGAYLIFRKLRNIIIIDM